MRDVEERTVRFVEVETQQPSPFARSLLFGYVAQFLYEGDSPLAERRAAALSLDATLLAELLGQQGYGGLRELLDPDAVAALARDLQRLSEDRRARDAEGVADLLRVLGPLTTAEAVERGAQPAWLADLEEARRAVRVRVAGEERWVAVEDAGRLRDALGTPLPVGIPRRVPRAGARPDRRPGRPLRPHPRAVHDGRRRAARLGLGAGRGRAGAGPARRRPAGWWPASSCPAAPAPEWCDAEVLRTLRRRSLAALRKEVEPVPVEALASFLPAWQQVGGRLRGRRGRAAGRRAAAGRARSRPRRSSRWCCRSRVAGYSPALLDELCAAGEVLWRGHGSLPGVATAGCRCTWPTPRT